MDRRVSLEWSSVCVVDATGEIVREAKVPSEPEALVAFFAAAGLCIARIGLEAGPLSQWLHAGLIAAPGPPIEVMSPDQAGEPTTRNQRLGPPPGTTGRAAGDPD